MDKLIAKIKEREKEIWLERPDDVAKMVGRNYNTGKEFSCWAYCWGYLSNLSTVLYTIYNLAKDNQGELATYKILASSLCEGYAGNFAAGGHMEEVVEILTDCVEGFKKVSDYEELAVLCRTLQRYLMQMSFWVDIELPWAEVCEYVHKRWHAEDRAIVKE